MLDLLVRDGRVVTESGVIEAHVGITSGSIAGLYPFNETPRAREVIDARNRVVMPGLIDAHVHPGVFWDFDEDVRSITRSAAVGGVTSMLFFHRPPESLLSAVPAAIERAADTSAIDFGVIPGITRLSQIREMTPVAMRFGVRAFKYYLGYKGHQERFNSDFAFDDTNLVQLLEALRDCPGDPLLCGHCENAEVNDFYLEQLRGERDKSLALFERLYPIASEIDSAVHFTLLGHLYGVRVCVVHVSSGQAAGILGKLPWFDPARTIVESCPHYLALDTDAPSGLRAVVRPPIRRPGEREGLWDALRAGTVTVIGSDNCSRDLEEKRDMDLWNPVLGVGEMSLSLPVLITEGHQARGLSLETIARVTSTNVARAHGLYPKKGVVRVGSDADLVVVDVEAKRRVDARRVKARDEGSVYEGWELTGWADATIASGVTVAAKGEFETPNRRGSYLYRKAE